MRRRRRKGLGGNSAEDEFILPEHETQTVRRDNVNVVAPICRPLADGSSRREASSNVAMGSSALDERPVDWNGFAVREMVEFGIIGVGRLASGSSGSWPTGTQHRRMQPYPSDCRNRQAYSRRDVLGCSRKEKNDCKMPR